jgi:hypothetical protein
MDFKLRTPNSELKTIFQRKSSFDEIFSQLTLADLNLQSGLPRKVLFWGARAGEISSYIAGWMVGKGMDVIVLDGANRFDPYMASSFARRALISPERLLKRIRIARAFTCYQMATMAVEKLSSLLSTESQKPWVILLGLITTFLDEDVPEREVRPLFERSLRKMEEMAVGGIPFFLFQPSVFSENSPFPSFTKRGMGGLRDSRRVYLMRRLFQFSNEVWRIDLGDEGPKIVLEKGLTKLQIETSLTAAGK